MKWTSMRVVLQGLYAVRERRGQGRKRLEKEPITREGFEALKKEKDELWTVTRPEITEKVSWAASLGDRSENADYHYNKKRLRQIDRRIRFLNKRLQSLYIVDRPTKNLDKVYFGAWVTVEDEEGENRLYRIVGTDEIYNAPKGYISFKSPVARALIGKELDDEVTVQTPNGEDLLCIVSIEYK